MRVLIACGRGMKAISDEMQRRFKNGTIKFDYVKQMEEVNSFLASNLGIERVIITSESFTHSREVREDELREQLIRLSNTLAEYDTTVVFIVSLDEFGPVIDEELFNYGDRVRVLKHSSAYTVKLFERLTLTDISKIESNYESNTLTSIEEVRAVEVEDSIEDDIFSQVQDEYEDEEDDYFEIDEEDYEDDYFEIDEESVDIPNPNDVTFSQDNDYGNIPNPSFESSATPITVVSEEEEDQEDQEDVQDDSYKTEETVEYVDETQEQEDELSSMAVDLGGIENVEITEVEDDTQDTIEGTQEVEEENQEMEEETQELEEETQEDSQDRLEGDIFGVFSEHIYDTSDNEDETEEENKEVVEQTTVVQTVTQENVEPQGKKKGFLSRLFGKKNKSKDIKVTTELPLVEPVKDTDVNDIPKMTYEEEYGNTQSDLVSSLDGDSDFSDDIYSNKGTELDVREAMTQKELDEITELLGRLSNRHASYVFTGTRNSGVTSIAYNISAVLSNLGFSVLYVDCDTHYRPLSYITKDLFNMVHVNDETSSSYLKAVGSPINIDNYVHIVMPGLHTITMGLEQDTTYIGRIVDKQKFRRFSGMVRDRYDFIIYDMPFEFLMSTGLETAFVSDNIVTVTEASTKGLMELLIKFGNIENEDARTLLFSKASILLNKYNKNTLYFGKKFKKQESLLNQLDNIGEEITGTEADFRFSNMRCLGVCPYTESINNCWFTNNIPVNDKIVNQNILNIIRAMVGGD